MDEYISKHDAYTLLKDLEAAYIYPPVKEAYATAARRIDQMKAADVQPVKKTEFQIGYEQGYKDGMAGAALPNVIDNGDKIDGYSYAYKTDSNGEPYIHIDSVRSMLKKAADVQAVRHGHWIEEVREIGETFRLYQTYIHCSECGKEHYSGTLPKPNFCDECGTRMDGDAE